MVSLLTNRVFWIAVVWALSIAGTAYYTRDYTIAKADQDKLKAVEQAKKEQQRLDDQTMEIAIAAAKRQQKTRIVYRERIKKVTEYVKVHPDRVQCFGTDGVQLYNSLRAGVEDAAGLSMRTPPTGD